MSGLAERARYSFGSGTVASRVALRIAEGVEFADWQDVGRRLISLSDGVAFWVGDWLAYGEWRYGDKYRTALTELELSYDRIRDYAYVAGNVPEPVRRDDLTWSHHRVVAKLIPAEQETWLARAAEAGWSYRQLAEELRCAPQLSPPPVAEPLEQFKLTISVGRLEAWQAAAERAGVATTRDWAIGVLDAEASRSR